MAWNAKLLCCALGALFCQAAQADDVPPRTPPVIIIASHSILPNGSFCRIEMQPETIDESATSITVYEGKIKKTTQDKVVLTAATVEMQCINNSPFTRVPFLSRYFKNTGVGRMPVEETDLEVSVARIRSITLMEGAKAKTDGAKKLRSPQIPPEERS